MTAKVVHRSETLEEGMAWHHIALLVSRNDSPIGTTIVIHTTDYNLFDQFRVGQDCDIADALEMATGGLAVRRKVQ